MERKDIPLILGLFFIALLIRVAGISNVCMYIDEWTYWNHANLILANNFVPREEVFKYTNPFLSYLLAGVTLLFDGELNTLRIVSVIFGSLTVPFLYLFGKAMYDKRTGLLSALLLCFSAFHCQYSRIIYLEALTLFFITAFLYFFWLSQRSESNRKNLTYACLAGATMGLAFDAKYMSLFLIPAVLAYVLWTGRFNFKALLDKRIILMFIFAFLFFLPLLVSLYYCGVGLEPFYYQAFGRFEKASITGTAIRQISPIALLIGSIDDFLDIVALGAEMLPWSAIFKLSAMLLFIIVPLSYLTAVVNFEREGCFLIIPYLVFYAFVYFGCSKHHYYFIYSLPFYFVMLSHLTIRSFWYLKDYKFSKKILWTFIISLVTIMLFSYLATGITSPYWDHGDYVGIQEAMSYIKGDILKDGNEKPLVIGTLTMTKPIDYQIHKSKLNASVKPIVEIPDEYTTEKFEVNLDMIESLKSDYIVLMMSEYEYYFKEHVKKEMLKNYKLVFQTSQNSDSSSQKRPYNYLVLKRVPVKKDEMQSPAIPMEYSGEICGVVFDRTVPEEMKIGKVYTALVQIRNTGASRASFKVQVHSDRYTIFIEPGYEFVTLDSGESRTFKFRMVPLTEYKEKVFITVDLYGYYEMNYTSQKLKIDTFSDGVDIVK